MLFNSLLFVAFFLGVFLLHAVLPHRARNLLLLAASYLFYAAWSWKFLALIWFSTLLDYAVGRVLGATTDPRHRRAALGVSLAGNLTLLGFFKYYNFFIDSLDDLVALVGWSAASLHLDLVLPLGISFYTFQTMSYAIDVYRGKMAPVRDLPDFALYVCFFPQLVAGPIERAHRLIPQIQTPRRITGQDLQIGFLLAAWGFFKKVVIADNLAHIVDPVYLPGASPTGLQVVLATVAFAFQGYADFSGYTDIARGAARLLGFRLSQNFILSYFAPDIREFWRRWHITLSTWLRDYVYFPLGGSRGSETRTAINLFLTFFLAGLWHGSDATFFLFGVYFGALMALNHWLRRWRGDAPYRLIWPRAIRTVLLLSLGLVFFRAQTLEQCFFLLWAVVTDFDWQPLWGSVTLLRIAIASAPLMLFDYFRLRTGSEFFLLRWPAPVRVAVYVAVFYAILLFGRAERTEFVYFQF